MPSFTLPPRDDSQPPQQPQQSQAQPAPAQQAQQQQAREYPVIPDGMVVSVEVVEVELRDRPEWAIRSADDETKEISFRFRVTDGPYAKSNVWGTASPQFDNSPKCRFRIWVQGILGVDEMPPGFDLSTEDVWDDRKGKNKTVFPSLAGRQARILVGNRKNKTTGKIRDFVQDVYAAEPQNDPYANEQPF
jgi:hypothetical protein